MRKRKDRIGALVCFWFGGVMLLLGVLLNAIIWTSTGAISGPVGLGVWFIRFVVGFISLGVVAFSIARFLDAIAYWNGEK